MAVKYTHIVSAFRNKDTVYHPRQSYLEALNCAKDISKNFPETELIIYRAVGELEVTVNVEVKGV